MALQNSQYDALMRYYQRLQFRNKHEQDARIAEAQARIPRLALIDQEIASISVKKARILLGDKNATDFDLNEQIQALSRERTDLLKANGYPEDYLKMHYTCPLCQDTGYVDNRKCICFRRAISEHLYTQSNIRELLKTASFDAFSLHCSAQKILFRTLIILLKIFSFTVIPVLGKLFLRTASQKNFWIRCTA